MLFRSGLRALLVEILDHFGGRIIFPILQREPRGVSGVVLAVLRLQRFYVSGRGEVIVAIDGVNVRDNRRRTLTEGAICRKSTRSDGEASENFPARKLFDLKTLHGQ